MSLKSTLLLIGGIAVIVILAAVALPSGSIDNGIDVRNTACEDIPAARLAVATELGERKGAAQTALDAERDEISDEYWAANQVLEAEYHQCISRALTADPCKEPFEEIGRLYEEIMADFAADKGFNEAKFNEREAAKKRYNDCVEETHKPDFYKDKETACDAILAAGREANLANRTTAEAAAKVRYDEAVARAESAHNEKQGILNAIAEKCQEPGGTTNVLIGPLTTEGSGAAVSPNNPACTGIFPGNDSELQRQISNFESQLQKAKAGGESGGLTGTEHIQETLDRLRQELKDSPRTCTADAECGNTEPICCSGTEVGRAVCSGGLCTTEKTECVSPEICAGKPAQCVAPFMGAGQSDGVYITRTIPEVGSCSQNLRVLNLEQATPESVRYSFVGNIPSWLHIDKPSGTLPTSVNVTYSCNTVQGFGPGTYTANGSITVHNGAGELINTIPFNVSITVTPSEKMIDVIEYNGKYLPVSQLIVEDEVGCGANHWHAAQGVVTATDGSKVSDPGPQCGYGKVKDKPIQQVPEPKNTQSGTQGTIEVRGLEFLEGN